jgi:hypothetical protein
MAWKDSDSFDRAFAHETGHTFGAPGEYESGKRSCDTVHGRFFTAKNGNRALCAGAVSMDSDYPRLIAGNWKGLPSSFESGIDAALMRMDNHKIYMFKGRKYVRYASVSGGIDPGCPNWIDKNRTPFPT